MGLRYPSGANYHRRSGTRIAGDPCTFSGWLRPDVTNVFVPIFYLGDSGSANNYFNLRMGGAGTGVYEVREAGSNSAATVNTCNADVWNHIVGRSIAADDHVCVLNGDFANKGTSVTTANPTSMDRTTIGRLDDSSPSDGNQQNDLAEIAGWNVALSDGEMLALAKGIPPTRIQPSNLIHYFALRGGNVVDLMVPTDTYTLTGSSSATEHAPITYFGQQQMEYAAAAAPPVGTHPVNPLGHPLMGPFGGPI